MSAAVLDRLQRDGVVTIDLLADIWSLAPHSVYPYFVDREMTYGKLRSLFRSAQDQRVCEAILNDLLPGTGMIAQAVDASLDVDGDGDVDTDDAVRSGLDQLARGADAMRELHAGADDGRITAREAERLLTALHDQLGQVMTTINIVRFLRDQEAKRVKLRQRPLGLGGRG